VVGILFKSISDTSFALQSSTKQTEKVDYLSQK